MAKLNGVQTLDMQNGEITRIEYEGVVYAWVDGITQAGEIHPGDIGLVGNREYDESIVGNSFYRMRKKPNERDKWLGIESDEQNDHNGLHYKHFTVFRKVAEISAPFAEMLTSKIDAVEKRVTVLEVGKQADELTPGDRVLISGRSIFGTNKDGKIGKFEGIDDDGDYSVTFNGDEKRLFRREQSTKVAGTDTAAPAPAKPKTGDIVVITANTHGSRNEVGDIGKIGQTTEEDARIEVIGGPTTVNWTLYSEMRLATPAEIAQYESAVAQATKDAVFAKAGRKPNEYRKGDLVRYLGDNSFENSLAEVVKDSDGSRVQIIMQPNRFAPKSTEKFQSVEIVCFAENRSDLAKGAC